MADRASIDRLLQIFENARQWPLERDKKYLEELYTWSYIRESDHGRVRAAANFDETKHYVMDPLGERIAQAFADLIFGEEPDFGMTSDSGPDQANLELIVEQNMLPSELQAAEEVNCSEGEAYWRVLVDRDMSDVPIIEWHSRTVAYPLFRGRLLMGVAFINVIEEDKRAWRYVEAHARGIVVNRLYEVVMPETNTARSSGSIVPQSTMPGKPFGREVPLEDRPETEGLPAEWAHELPIMLAGRVINRRTKDPRRGRSQYAGVKDLLFSLNEAATIGHQNMKLTAKKRAVVDASVMSPAVDASGQTIAQPPLFDAHEDVIIAQTLDESLDGNQPGPFKVMEYTFDSLSLINWYEHLVDTILTRCRTAPQLVGRHTEQAQSAPALRARLLDSTLAASGMGRQWDDQVPKSLQAAVLVDKLSTPNGGFGRSYGSADELPTMKRKSIIPEDEDAKVNRHATARGALIESLHTAVSDMHPEWTDDEVTEEIDRIRAEEGIATTEPPPPDETGGVDGGSA